MDSEAIQNFCAVTGAEPDVASGYLQVSDNNVEQAISLFFESGGQPLQSTNTNTATTGAAAPVDTDEVRAPIESRRDVLVDYYDEGPAINSGFFRPGMGGGFRRSTQASSSIFHQRAAASAGGGSLPGVMPSMSFAPEAQEAGSSGNAHQDSDSDNSEGYGGFLENVPAPSAAISTSRRNLLADLFKPPFEIMHHGDLQSARRLAQAKHKWIMINLQDVSEFSCQALNRDVWKQEIVKEVVSKNFVFMQTTIDTSEGSSLANMYDSQAYPFIAIVHPKTGELRQKLTRYKSSTDILEDIANFLHDNPVKQLKPGNKQGNTSSASSSGGGSSQQQPTKKVENMTEDEQLARAIAASELETEKKGKKQVIAVRGSDSELSDTDDDNVNSYSEIESIDSPSSSVNDDDMDIDDVSEAHEKMAEEATSADAWYWSLPTAVPAEPELGPTVTRIQLRFPNGKRVVRRFAKADTVISIFQFLKATLPEAAKDVPEAQFMNQRLSECIGQTIEEAKLVNASVAVDI